MEATSTAILNTIGVTQSWYPMWMLGPEKFDIMATIILGILAVWAREIYKHYDPDSPVETNWRRFFIMIFPGAMSGFMGGEIAGLTNNDEATWLYALVIGYGGAPVLNMLTETVVGIMQKALTAMGADFEKQQAKREEEKAKDEERRNEMRRAYEDKQFKEVLEKDVSVEETVETPINPVPTPISIVTNLPQQFFSQLNPLWKNIPLPNASANTTTIGMYGCWLSCIGTLIQVKPPELAERNKNCFMSDGNMMTDKLLKNEGLTMEKQPSQNGSNQPNKPCVGRTSWYASKGFPTHFYIALPGGKMIDPARSNPIIEDNKYLSTTNEWRILNPIKISV